MKVILAQPRGFCAGVERAIDVVEESLKRHLGPVYVRHEIVHNRHVVDNLREKGAVFVDEIEEIPEGAPVIFSAHGVSKEVRSAANFRALNAIDATCPLVTKVHKQVSRLHSMGYEILLIGHEGDPEVEGTLGQLEGNIRLIQSVADAETIEVRHPWRVAYVTQTTLSLDDTAAIVAVLKRRFPALEGPPTADICYATQNRQEAVKRLAGVTDVVIVVGAENSSNSNRLVEVARSHGTPAHRVASAAELEDDWFGGDQTVGITAGASVPETLVEEVADFLRERFGAEVGEDAGGFREEVFFPLPIELREEQKAV